MRGRHRRPTSWRSTGGCSRSRAGWRRAIVRADLPGVMRPGHVGARARPAASRPAMPATTETGPGLVLPPSARTRFAPAPTGFLHLGHVANAIWVWGAARIADATVLLRIEDHDRGRSRPAYDAALIEDLAWLGFVADEGPVRQSDDDAP